MSRDSSQQCYITTVTKFVLNVLSKLTLDCIVSARFKVGQNLYSSSSTRLENIPEWKRAVYAWYDEVAMFDPQNIEPFV